MDYFSIFEISIGILTIYKTCHVIGNHTFVGFNKLCDYIKFRRTNIIITNSYHCPVGNYYNKRVFII